MSKSRDLANFATAGSTVSATELGYVDGVTSAIQTQLDGKSATSHNHNGTYEPALPSQTGNAGKYLTTDGTNKSWGTISSGGMTLLSTTTLSGASTTINSISASYVNLVIFYNDINLSTSGNVYVDVNTSTSLCNYNYFDSRGSSIYNANSSSIINGVNDWKGSDINNGHVLTISDYASSKNYKGFHLEGIYSKSADSSAMAWTATGGLNYTSGAISSIRFRTSTGTFSGGTVKIYGVK